MMPTRKMRKQLERENRKWPEQLQRVTVPPNIQIPRGQIEVWRSRRFLVQVFDDGYPGIIRLSVCRTTHDGNNWIAGITWEDLQNLKSECGRGHLDAVEVYPADKDVVNVANMRHLFVFDDPLSYAWRVRSSQNEKNSRW